MDQQPAAVAFIALPAAKIIGAVLGIQQPFKMNREDLANSTGRQQLADFAVMRRVAIIESDASLPAGAPDSVQNNLALIFIDSHRFFADPIAAQYHRPHDIMMMGAIDRGDDYHIRPGLGNHAIELLRMIERHRRVSLCADESVGVGHSDAVGIAERHLSRPGAEIRRDGVDIKSGASPGAD